MGPPPNSTTKFDLAFLIIWILLTIVLMILNGLRKLSLPNILQPKLPGATFTYVFAFLQLAMWVFLLAALAADQWSQYSFPFGGGTFYYGVVAEHNSGSSTTYSCSGTQGNDNINLCNTPVAAGAWTLIFGLITIFVSFFLTLIVLFSALNQSFLNAFKVHVPCLALFQLIGFIAMMMIWGISAHNVVYLESGSDNNLTLGASWALIVVDVLLGIPVALYFAAGVGATGAISSGPASAGTSQAASAQSSGQAPEMVVVPQ